MANSGAVWGIDIGQCALKALRCRAHEKDTNRIVVEAFDYIEYPKILSQPDADREELVREAIETFLSRNEVKGDRVAISVPGQSGLARFIKLPPVEAKKIPDIVKYEAKQQIPFHLEDVVWDYQALEGGSQEEGYALETEVGLFAMKRDVVARALEPFENAGIEVDLIQLAPLAVYNYTCFDRLNNMVDAEPYDPAEPAPSIVVMSFGADTTDLVITNGYRVWQRNIPIGGSHFTKAITKEMKLTFAKAEQLKRNARKAEDPKKVFQAMRPVFSSLADEIQRSLRFFMSNNKGAKLDQIIALGNPMKLPGLERFLTQQLEQPIHAVEEFPGLVGGSVTASPQFEENRLAFATAYGLCVQGLGLSQLSTNLLPEEMVTSRLIRSKKPWAVAAAALLMVGMAANYASYFGAWQTVNIDKAWSDPIQASKSLATVSSGFTSQNSELKTQFETIQSIGNNLQSNAEGRLLWLELLMAIDRALPKDERPREERLQTEADVSNRREIHIDSMEVQYFSEESGGLATWFQGGVAKLYDQARKTDEYFKAAEAEAAAQAKAAEAAKASPEGAAKPPAEASPEEVVADETPGAELLAEDPAMDDADAGFAADEGFGGEEAPVGPTGPGFVVELTGHHFHNANSKNPDVKVTVNNEGEEFVRKTIIKNLLEKSIQLPDGPGGEMVDVPLTKLGVSYPIIVLSSPIQQVKYDPEALEGEEAGRGRGGIAEEELRFGAPALRSPVAPRVDEPVDPDEGLWKLNRYDFTLQFIWQPTPRSERNKPEGEGEAEVGFDETAYYPKASLPRG
jgi:type IV pilus assembly protein PilM